MEYFIRTNSFAAPFVSDTGDCYVVADSPSRALAICASEYSHPCGLYAAEAYANADAFHKGEKPLARWLSNREIAQRQATAGRAAYSMFGVSPGEFDVDGVRHVVADPKGGRVVKA